MPVEPDTTDAFIGKQLRAAREAQSMPLTKLGSLVGLSHTQLLKYELGRNRIPASTLWRLTGALQIGINDVFPGFSDGVDFDDIAQRVVLDRVQPDVRIGVQDLIDLITIAEDRLRKGGSNPV